MMNKNIEHKNQKFSIKKRFMSFTYAINGFKIFIQEENTSILHLAAAIVAIIFAIIFKLNSMEWIVIILSIGLVISTEIINTSIECIADFISPGYSEKIKKIKDLAASAVLLNSLAAFIIAMIIFLPKLITSLNQ